MNLFQLNYESDFNQMLNCFLLSSPLLIGDNTWVLVLLDSLCSGRRFESLRAMKITTKSIPGSTKLGKKEKYF